jgi:uracil-DNA glycosylase family 4
MKVPGEGPVPARVMLIGEGPGREEEYAGRPFVGQSGQELNRYLETAGLDRSQLYITNMVKWRMPDNADPDEEAIERDREELIEEIRSCQPEIICTIGRIATRHFLGDVDMEAVHGIPHTLSGGRPIHILPSYHPAFGLRSPDAQNLIQYDIMQLGHLVRRQIGVRTVDKRALNYVERLDSVILHTQLPVALDTEGLQGRAWGLSMSTHAGTAVVVRKRPADITADIRANPVLLHNALHDLPILRELGVDTSGWEIVDTMVMAYLLGVEPQGLKALAYRHAGMEMTSYSELVRDAGQRLAKQYVENLRYQFSCPTCSGRCVVPKQGKKAVRMVRCGDCNGDGLCIPPPPTQMVVDPATGLAKPYNPQSLGTRTKKLLEEAQSKPELNIRDRWLTIDEAVREPAESVLGPVPEPTLDDIDHTTAINYSARDADATLRVYYSLLPRLEAANLTNILRIDCGIIPMLDRMQTNGMLIDPDHFTALEGELAEKNRRALNEVQSLTGRYLNPNSSQQVGRLLFNEFALPPIKKTKSQTAESTDDKVLEALKLKVTEGSKPYRVIELILDYREREKLIGTYCRPLRAKADAAKRVHTTIKYTRTATGRLSSADPNLQNIPARTDAGKLIRGGFIAPPGMVLLGVDYSQIEMVVLADISQDAQLLSIFRDGPSCPIALASGKCRCHDMHYLTAAKAYRVELDDVTAEQRALSKNINFGVVYRISAYGLKQQMDQRGQRYTEDQCQEMIDGFFVAYPGVKQYFWRTDAQAMTQGYVTDMFGRRKLTAGARSTIERTRNAALREITNFPIQSSAGGILKLAMIDLWNGLLPELWEREVHCEPLMQVHDELIFEVEENAVEYVAGEIQRVMEAAVELSVPVRTSANWGRTWAELKG